MPFSVAQQAQQADQLNQMLNQNSSGGKPQMFDMATQWMPSEEMYDNQDGQ